MLHHQPCSSPRRRLTYHGCWLPRLQLDFAIFPPASAWSWSQTSLAWFLSRFACCSTHQWLLSQSDQRLHLCSCFRQCIRASCSCGPQHQMLSAICWENALQGQSWQLGLPKRYCDFCPHQLAQDVRTKEPYLWGAAHHQHGKRSTQICQALRNRVCGHRLFASILWGGN